MPSDPRLGQLRSNCRVAIVPTPQTLNQSSPYVVDGLALGGQVIFESHAYKQYQCSPSEKFPGFTWCHKEETKKENHNEILSSNSILHTPDGTAWYINRYIEPAFFAPNDVQSEIDRLSAKFGESSREFRMPRREGLPNAVIAVWGKVQLEQLNADDVSVVAAGGRHDGILVSFLGYLQRSAKAGVPVYQLSGGAGFLWAATYNQEGRGVLRFLTIDASQIASPIVARNNLPPQQPTQACPLATPGPGFPVSGGKIVITREAFDIGKGVEDAITATFGNDATIADWQTLKRLFSTQTELSNFIEQVGIPRQTQNGPCDNFLVSNEGRYRLANGYWLFLARHDGRVPENWAVLDSIGNHTLDLGRWTHKSQALVFIPNTAAQPLPSSPPPPSAPPNNAQEAQQRAELEKAKQVAEDAERRRIAAEDAAKRAADEARRRAEETQRRQQAAEDDARRAADEAQQQIEAERQKQNIILGIAAGTIIVLGSVVAFLLLRRRRPKSHAVASAPVASHIPKIQAPQAATEKSFKSELQRIDRQAETKPNLSLEEGDFVDQLAAFAKLRADGVLTDEEFKTLKAGLIGMPPLKEATSNEYIKQLKKLRDAGAITESEFQSKVLASLSTPTAPEE
jgi:hypothetical protein